MSDITTKELKHIFPSKKVTISGVPFTLKPFNVKELLFAMDQLKSVIGALRLSDDPEEMAKVLIGCGAGIVEVTAMSLHITKEEFEQFDMANAMKAIVNIITINKDFFIQRVQKELEGLNALLVDKEEN